MPVQRRRVPAGDEDGHEALDRISPRRSALAALMFDLPGGRFAFVMATGIVSIATMRPGHGKVGAVLFADNLVAFPLLSVLMLGRLFQHPGTILSELRHHRTGPGFLTVVAATSIFGDQFVLFGVNNDVSAALWLASLALWVGVIYAFFVVMTIKPLKQPLALGLDGAWLLTAWDPPIIPVGILVDGIPAGYVYGSDLGIVAPKRR